VATYSVAISTRFSNAGVGTLVKPEYWVPAIEMDLPAYSIWSQFLGERYGDVDVFGQGQGQYFHINVLGDLPLGGTTALASGTKVGAADSSGLTQVTGTINEYGYSEALEAFQAWVANADMQQASAVSMARNAMLTRNYLIGATFIGNTTNYFTCDGTSSASKGTYTGTRGTNPISPDHVRQIASELRRLGVAPFPDGYYRWVGAPGMFDDLKKQSEVYSSASQLNIEGIYAMGDIFKFGGFLFIEEFGPHAVTTYSATVGTTVVFGNNAVVGGDDFARPDLIRYYSDHEQDFGRKGLIGWVAHAGYTRPVDGAANGRSWLVYSKGA
jgi:hypothetical protein